ncbi:hypothetical protein J2741_001751 [Methanolinea mesophila]|uniref:hypothetical protein n=1 Tax=Methanolinea mesophila TaxID=547055 RepID=UPI001AEA8974|nr:hypothetical protein [Methanolinea mesophila]MBP1929204.1 hypothetical protein [Methanolinea mesophila]
MTISDVYAVLQTTMICFVRIVTREEKTDTDAVWFFAGMLRNHSPTTTNIPAIHTT